MSESSLPGDDALPTDGVLPGDDVLSSEEEELPPGNHPLEVAARRGFGPLSPQGRQVWHGDAKPCVSCGQLVKRTAAICDSCDQDLSEAMLEKMRAHAGPWYVLEHVRPFPGVNLERIVRQVRRGVITESSIVRGPTTDYQWRFAVETPGLCRYFGRCWHCHGPVSPTESHCRHCRSLLTFDQAGLSGGAPSVAAGQARGVVREAAAGSTAPAGEPAEVEPLRQLSAAAHRAGRTAYEPVWDEPPRVGGVRATWIAAVLMAAAVVALMWVAQQRNVETSQYQNVEMTPSDTSG